MPFIIRGKWYNRVVTVGHYYNDTATHQVQVLDIREPSENYPEGMIRISGQELAQGYWEAYDWKLPVVIGAEWKDSA